ncbi:IS1004 transposase, partial [Erwinia tracheiphila PSU-1]
MNPLPTYYITVSIILYGHRSTDTKSSKVISVKRFTAASTIYSNMKKCTVVELNVQIYHMHLVVRTPPGLGVSELMEFVKGRTDIRLFEKFPYLRKHKLWCDHFWQRGYFVDSVGAKEEVIRRYVRYQDKVAKEEEERQIQLGLERWCLSPLL